MATNKFPLVVAFLFLLPFASFAQAGFSLMGNVKGLADSAEVKITTTHDDPQNVATGKVSKGSFMLTGSVQEPGLYFLVLGNEQPQYIYLDNSEIAVQGDKADLKNLLIKGSSSHDDFLAFRKIFDPLVGQMNATAAQLSRSTVAEEQLMLRSRYDSLSSVTQTRIDEYVNAHPASHVSAFLLVITMQLNDDVHILENRFNKLTAAIQQTGIGQSLKQQIDIGKIGAVGTQALDFTQPDVNGNDVTLSSFKGKYVLVDFWASWCRPCRIENPNVVANYEKFKDKNFTILGVSLDRPGQKENWLKAIEQDKLNWTNVSDLKFWDNAAARLYNVSGIPFNFLMDPDGRIIARNLRGDELGAKLCEILGGCN